MVRNLLADISILLSLTPSVSNSYGLTMSTKFLYFFHFFWPRYPTFRSRFPSLHYTLIGTHDLYAGPVCAGILN